MESAFTPPSSSLDKTELFPAISPGCPNNEEFTQSKLPSYLDQITRNNFDIQSLGKTLIDVTDTTEMIRKAYATKSELR